MIPVITFTFKCGVIVESHCNVQELANNLSGHMRQYWTIWHTHAGGLPQLMKYSFWKVTNIADAQVKN